jgi:hypothetical protein
MLSSELAPQQLVMTFNRIKDWKDNLKALEDAGRNQILNLMKERQCEVSPAGSAKTIVDGWVLETRPTGAKWDEAAVSQLLLSKQLPKEKWMEQTVSYKVDESKLAVLVELGKITQAEMDACRNQRGVALQPPHQVATEEEGDE